MTEPTPNPNDRNGLPPWLSSAALRAAMVIVAAAIAFQAVRGAVAINGERISRVREVHDRDIATLREVITSMQQRMEKADIDSDCVQTALSEIRVDIRELKTLLQSRPPRKDIP